MTVPKLKIDIMEAKNNIRTIEAQIFQKLKNEARPKFTGSYKKACSTLTN